MSASMDIPFALGSYAWYAEAAAIDTWAECPECMGGKTVYVRLGNGEKFTLACDRCSRSYEPPTGRIKITDYGFKPSKILCRRISGFHQGVPSYTESPEDSTAYRTYPSDKMFTTEAECEAECEKMREREKVARVSKDFDELKRRGKNLASSVSHWRSQIARCRQELERYEARLDMAQDMERRKSWKIT